MRNYWLRIALGAAAIFSVGMIGISLARQGAHHVRGVVEGSGPISLSVPFLPFNLNGQKLGRVGRITLLREAPKKISAVELEIELRDSVVARGLEGCRLAANFEERGHSPGVSVNNRRLSSSVFTCLSQEDSAPDFQEFGRAVFQPGDVSVPLLLPNDIVNDLREGEFDGADEDSISAAAEAIGDSIAEVMEQRADSIAAAAEERADSIVALSERLVDSLRTEGIRRADSARRVAGRADDPNAAR
ncbi:MAG TPA: hypothetical protein VE420_13140 [Gemmatimonadales bacterium]|jgi:hypothetical protein|nr:hypothetical protein [Gemmatimonadales bacterium]